MRARTTARLIALTAAVMLSACQPQSEGFVLPPGDPEAGRAAFVALGCNSCHRIEGIVDRVPANPEDPDVGLGGPVSRVKTYGDLVGSIIHPSQKIASRSGVVTATDSGESRMRDFNEQMNVKQLVDIAAFLQGTYKVPAPEYTFYRYF